MNAAINHEKLDLDMAAILGLGDTFFLPKSADRKIVVSTRPMVISASLAVSIGGALLVGHLLSSAPASQRASFDLASPRGAPAIRRTFTARHDPGPAHRHPAIEVRVFTPLRGPREPFADDLRKGRSATEAKNLVLVPKPHTSSPVKRPMRRSDAQVDQASSMLAGSEDAATVVEGEPSQVPVAGQEAEPLASRLAPSGSDVRSDQRALARREAIDAIRALRH